MRKIPSRASERASERRAADVDDFQTFFVDEEGASGRTIIATAPPPPSVEKEGWDREREGEREGEGEKKNLSSSSSPPSDINIHLHPLRPLQLPPRQPRQTRVECRPPASKTTKAVHRPNDHSTDPRAQRDDRKMVYAPDRAAARRSFEFRSRHRDLSHSPRRAGRAASAWRFGRIGSEQAEGKNKREGLASIHPSIERVEP